MAPQERRDRAIAAHHPSSSSATCGTLVARADDEGTLALVRRAKTPSFLNRVSQVRILPGAQRVTCNYSLVRPASDAVGGWIQTGRHVLESAGRARYLGVCRIRVR